MAVRVHHRRRSRSTPTLVVIAAGSWSGGIPMAPSVPLPVRPIRGQLLQLRFRPPPISRIVWGSAATWCRGSDGTVLVGATVEDVGLRRERHGGGVRQLLDARRRAAASHVVPAFNEVRVGLRPATPDELPVIGASSTMRGVYYATGHYRNGVLLAPLTALMLADLMLDGRERDGLAADAARIGSDCEAQEALHVARGGRADRSDGAAAAVVGRAAALHCRPIGAAPHRGRWLHGAAVHAARRPRAAGAGGSAAAWVFDSAAAASPVDAARRVRRSFVRGDWRRRADDAVHRRRSALCARSRTDGCSTWTRRRSRC